MSAAQYYQGNDAGGAADNRGFNNQPPSGYDYNPQAQAYNAAQAQAGQYGNYPPPNSAPPQGAYPQQPQQVYNGGGNNNNGTGYAFSNENYSQPGPTPNNYNMKPSAPYAPPPPDNGGAEGQYNNYHQQDTAPFSQANEKTGERMNPKARFNDIIFLILFILTFLGFVALSVLALRDFASYGGLGGGFGRGSGGSSATLNL